MSRSTRSGPCLVLVGLSRPKYTRTTNERSTTTAGADSVRMGPFRRLTLNFYSPLRDATIQIRGIRSERGEPNVVIDGSPNEGTVLTLTHWPGFPQPDGFQFDLSAEMAYHHLDHADQTSAG